MEDVRQIKSLNTLLKKHENEASVLKAAFTSTQKEYAKKIEIIRELKEQIKKLDGNKIPKVSEHAILRYLERVKGINTEEIVNEILSKEVLKMVETLGGSGTYPNKDFHLKMKDYTVVTVI